MSEFPNLVKGPTVTRRPNMRRKKENSATVDDVLEDSFYMSSTA